MSYQLTGNPNVVIRATDGLRISQPGDIYLGGIFDEVPPAENTLWKEYQAWLDAGNTPLPPSKEMLEEARQYLSCKRIQAFIAIEDASAGKIDGVTAPNLAADFKAWMTDPARTLKERALIDSENWERMHEIVQAFAPTFALTDEEVDAIFRYAQKQ